MASISAQRALSLFDFGTFYRRGMRRSKIWARKYKAYLENPDQPLPFPSVLHVMVTERCNLRCPMCNQWGENGYLKTGKREASSAPIDELSKFLGRFGELSPDYLLSINGGEPFMYKESERLIELIERSKTDLMFFTNGTLLGRYAEPLARINRHMVFFLSVDGAQETHDKIRGPGMLEKAIEGVSQLREACLRAGTGLPKVMVNYTVNEHNPDDIESVIPVARKIGALVLNYNLRWFVREESGHAYNRQLESEFGVKPTNAWTGWVSNHNLETVLPALDRLYDVRRKRMLQPWKLPWLNITPRKLNRRQAKTYYMDFEDTFGISKCAMPSYMARIYSNGDLIYCPGHPDIVPGNVYRDDFAKLFHNSASTQLRKKVEKELLPICNRCCGLYMTNASTRHLGPGWEPS